MKRNNLQPDKTTIAVQGFGNAGYHFARLKEKIDKEAVAILELAEEKKVTLRTAAYLQGVTRIAGAISEKGTREYFRNG